MKIVVTDYAFDNLDMEMVPCKAAGHELIGMRSGTEQERIDLVRNADAVIVQFAPINKAVIDAMQQCRVIVRYGIGVDNVDLKAAAAKGIPVCNVPDYCIDEVADHALAMILDLTRKISVNAAKVRGGAWGLATPLTNMFALKDITVGVVGFGRIGREVAHRLKAFKGKVLVHDPMADAGAIRDAGCEPASLDELLKASDLVTLHCPSVEQTKYMINAVSIATMKDGAMLVNTSRGTLVNTPDLIAALKSGKISAAALDVTDPEPPDLNGELVKLPNVVINSHIASCSGPAFKKLRTTAAALAIGAVEGKKLNNIVNGVGL